MQQSKMSCHAEISCLCLHVLSLHTLKIIMGNSVPPEPHSS